MPVASSVTDLDQRRVAEWIGEAFCILSVRISGYSAAETKLRLRVEGLMRHLGTPPLRLVSDRIPPRAALPTALGDVRLILKLLDRCLETFARYAPLVSPSQQHLRALVLEARGLAADELIARTRPTALPVAACAAA